MGRTSLVDAGASRARTIPESRGRGVSDTAPFRWELACPTCHDRLTSSQDDERRCPSCDVIYRRVAGIWRMLIPGREEVFLKFVEQYETVRSAEGRRVQSANQLRALPFRDLSRKRRYEWAIRARGFRTLMANVVRPAEHTSRGPLRVLDLGSGLAWLSNRLALRGHRVAAVDLLTNDFDGLGVHRHYESEFLPVQAEFEHLPFSESSIDLAIYNASLHYAPDYATTLREALRVLAPRGCLVIMDTPVYRDPSSGAAMVREREDAFGRQFGFRGDTLRGEGFLTYQRLDVLAGQLALQWELLEPWYGVRWWLKPLLARIRRSREPARFKLVVGRRAEDSNSAESPTNAAIG
jgi:SAM-dependent methyltransferase